MTDIQGAVGDVVASVRTDLQGTANNIIDLIGPKQVDSSQYQNGEQSLSWFAFNAWNNVVQLRDRELANINATVANIDEQASAANSRLETDVQPKINNIIDLVGPMVGDHPVSWYAFNAWDNGAKVQRIVERIRLP